MGQVKKESVRNTILEHAEKLFRKHGYLQCKMSDIAKSAGMAVANIYVYFPSKLHVFYAIFAPIMTGRMERLATEARRIRDPERRLRFLLLSLWQDMPVEKETSARNLLQALVTAPEGSDKPHELLNWCEQVLSELIRECLPESRKQLMDTGSLSFLLWMAFDGFVANAGHHEQRDLETLTRTVANLLLGKAHTGAQTAAAPVKVLARASRK